MRPADARHEDAAHLAAAHVADDDERASGLSIPPSRLAMTLSEGCPTNRGHAAPSTTLLPRRLRVELLEDPLALLGVDQPLPLALALLAAPLEVSAPVERRVHRVEEARQRDGGGVSGPSSRYEMTATSRAASEGLKLVNPLRGRRGLLFFSYAHTGLTHPTTRDGSSTGHTRVALQQRQLHLARGVCARRSSSAGARPCTAQSMYRSGRRTPTPLGPDPTFQ